MFLIPVLSANFMGLNFNPESASLLRGMGALIIGTGMMNNLIYKSTNFELLKVVLITNIISHLLGISVDFLGVYQGVLSAIKFAPVEVTHLFVGIGSAIYLIMLKKE
jgi:hypothetical protein